MFCFFFLFFNLAFSGFLFRSFYAVALYLKLKILSLLDGRSVLYSLGSVSRVALNVCVLVVSSLLGFKRCYNGCG